MTAGKCALVVTKRCRRSVAATSSSMPTASASRSDEAEELSIVRLGTQELAIQCLATQQAWSRRTWASLRRRVAKPWCDFDMTESTSASSKRSGFGSWVESGNAGGQRLPLGANGFIHARLQPADRLAPRKAASVGSRTEGAVRATANPLRRRQAHQSVRRSRRRAV